MAKEAEVVKRKPEIFEDSLSERRAALARRHTLLTTVNERAASLRALQTKVDAFKRKDTRV